MVWIGMMTWMCVDTTVRAAYGKEFKNVLVSDGTASGWLKDERGIIELETGGTWRLIRQKTLALRSTMRHYSAMVTEVFMARAGSAFDVQVEDIILSHGDRGMDGVRGTLRTGYCTRAAELFLENKGRVLIATGFPVEGTFETDGPVGAIALYRVLEYLGSVPEFICAPPISRVLAASFRTREIPVLPWDETVPIVERALRETEPSLVFSIERPGVARDGRYYNMRKRDITHRVAKLDLFFRLCDCPTVAIGDGGNEIGMGNVTSALAALPIIPSATTCDELVIAAVSNWGVYGIVACMSRALGQNLFPLFDPAETIDFLVNQGAVDGKTGSSEPSEDGFPLSVGLAVIERLEGLLSGR